MKRHKILLTGDDGYNAIGIRLLIHFLRQDHDLTIVATKTQQSAMGGKLSVQKGCSYGETTIDGIRALWVDGSPGDAMEFAYGFFPEKFDLILSGMNLGENISSAIVSSGTVMGALRGVGLGVAPKAIALSWMTPGDFYFQKHDEKEDLQKYLQYPGEVLAKTVLYCLSHDLWGAQFLNVNLPKTMSTTVRITRLGEKIHACYPPVRIHESTQTFSYPFEEWQRPKIGSDYDLDTLEEGKISITPLTVQWTHEKVYTKIKEKEDTLT